MYFYTDEAPLFSFSLGKEGEERRQRERKKRGFETRLERETERERDEKPVNYRNSGATVTVVLFEETERCASLKIE